MNKSRLEAFSDGVFAIVITLLILNVKLPETDYKNLSKALTDILPSIGVYILSFLLVGMYWMFHHYAFTLITKVNGTILWMNIIFLLFISFLPFPTLLMGKYPFQTLPVIIYGSNLLLANGTGLFFILYIRNHRDLASDIFTDEVLRMQMQLYLTVNLAYIIAIIIGWWWPTISCIIFALMALSLICRAIIFSGTGREYKTANKKSHT